MGPSSSPGMHGELPLQPSRYQSGVPECNGDKCILMAGRNKDPPSTSADRQNTTGREAMQCKGALCRADVHGTDIRCTWPERLSLSVTYQNESVRIETGLFGDLLTSSILAAVSGALAAGFSLNQCAASLKSIETFPRRMSIHSTSQRVWFISDTCKAPYWSIGRVLALLTKVEAPRKTIVFGSFSDTSGSSSDKYRSTARDALKIADR